MSLDASLDVLVARFAAAAAAVPGVSVKVYEGPDRDALTDGRTHLLFVGTDGESLMVPDGEEADGIVESETPSEMGPPLRAWSAQVTCSAWAWTGDADMRARRREAGVIADACRTSVLADRTLGGVLVPPGFADVTGVAYRLRHTSKGAVARAVFTVDLSSLLSD